jgi:hypothetical protein
MGLYLLRKQSVVFEASTQICRAFNSSVGKTVRILVSEGLSRVPGTGGLLGLGASVIDAFILERLAPRDAVVVFLSDLYPSVFTK